MIANMVAWMRRVGQAMRSGSTAPSPKPAPADPSPQQIDAVMRDFARRYHTSPPWAAVGVAVPKGWDLRSFTTEALKRYPDAESTR